MPSMHDIDDFLAQKRIALVGVSRNPKQLANMVYGALKKRGYQVYPVNPNADSLEGDRCYPYIRELPESVDGAMIMLQPAAVPGVVNQCIEAGIPRVWMGLQSVSPEAVQLCREKGIAVINGVCPMMFVAPVGFVHRCHRFILKLAGKLPK